MFTAALPPLSQRRVTLGGATLNLKTTSVEDVVGDTLGKVEGSGSTFTAVNSFFYIYIFAFNHRNFFTRAHIKAVTEDLNTNGPSRTTERHLKNRIIHRMTRNIHRQAGSDAERLTAISLLIQRNKYKSLEEPQSTMKAIWHLDPESASISPQAQKQQSIFLPKKDNLLHFFGKEQSGKNSGRSMQKKKHVKIQLVQF